MIQAVLVSAAIAAVIVPIVISLSSRRRPGLRYGLTPRPIEVGGDPEKVAITFQGRRVDGVYIVSLTLQNSGNREIVVGDFQKDEPLSFLAGPDAEILGTTQVRSDPPKLTLKVEDEVTDECIRVVPRLLNKGDVVSIDIAIAGYTGDLQPELEGRLTGVKQFTPGYQWKQDRPPRMAWRAALAGVVLGAAAVLAGIIVNDVVHDDTPYSEVRLRDGTVICGSIKYLGEKRAAITSKSEGRLRVLPLQSIGKTKEDSC